MFFSSFLIIYLLVVGIELDAHCAFLDGILCIFSHLYFSYMIMFFTPFLFDYLCTVYPLLVDEKKMF